MRRATRRWSLVIVLMLALAACTAPPASPTAQAPTMAAAPASPTYQADTPVGELRESPPPATPMATPGPPHLAVELVASPFERRHLAPGTPIAQAGIFFMQVATGEVEAWSLATEAANYYETSPDNRWVIAHTSWPNYAADRRTGAVFRWDGPSIQLLAAQGDHLLFLGGEQIWLGGTGRPEPLPLPIRPLDPDHDPWPLVSPDGQTAVVLNGRTVYLVHLETGACRIIDEVADPPGGVVQWIEQQRPQQGEPFVLTAHVMMGSGGDQQELQQVRRYSWQGEPLGGPTLPGGRGYTFSPDGRLVIWGEQVSYVSQAMVVADAATLAPRFRLLGNYCCLLDGSSRWLADGSGLTVGTSAGYRILTADGALVDAPALHAAPGGPHPAPDRADLFAIGHTAVVDASGRVLASAVLGPEGSQWSMPADLYPWGLDSSELRFALPHLGHGGNCDDCYPLPARVELAPFRPLVLAVGLPTNDCVNLRAEPGASARVLACLPGGTRLSPAPLAEARQSAGGVYHLTQGMALTGNRCWLRVRAPDGQEGWVDAEAGKVGWAQ